MAKLLQQAPGERIVLDSPREELTAFLAARPAGKIVLFTGRRSAERSGGLELVESARGGRGIHRFSEIEPEPGTETVERMAALLVAEKPTTVIALGGGSVMDAAKGAYLVAQTGWPLDQLFGVNQYSHAHPEAKLDRVICIPTTSGTGSEATPYSNIVDHAAGVKKLISETMIVPEFALLVPELTYSMPPGVTLATGCDALAHAIEGFLNGVDQTVDAWAAEAIRLIVENLPGAMKNEPEARRNMSIAAALAGMVIRFKPTGLPHLASFSWFGKLEHGIAVAALLPACWRYYLGNPKVAERTMELARVFPGGSPEAVIASYRKFLDSLGVLRRLADCPAITPELLAKTAKSASANRMKLEKAPLPVPLEQAEEILGRILRES